MYAGMYTRRLYIQGGAVEKRGRMVAATAVAAAATAASAIGCASPLEGNKGGATQRDKGCTERAEGALATTCFSRQFVRQH